MDGKRLSSQVGGSQRSWSVDSEIEKCADFYGRFIFTCFTCASLSPLFPAADCERPETPHDMELTEETLLMSSFPEGLSVVLVCYDGYHKTGGTGRVTCTGGNWTQPDLICASESLSWCTVPLFLAGGWGGIRDSPGRPLLFSRYREGLRCSSGSTKHDFRFERWH